MLSPIKAVLRPFRTNTAVLVALGVLLASAAAVALLADHNVFRNNIAGTRSNPHGGLPAEYIMTPGDAGAVPSFVKIPDNTAAAKAAVAAVTDNQTMVYLKLVRTERAQGVWAPTHKVNLTYVYVGHSKPLADADRARAVEVYLSRPEAVFALSQADLAALKVSSIDRSHALPWGHALNALTLAAILVILANTRRLGLAAIDRLNIPNPRIA